MAETELKARKDMDPSYQWDFSHIFKDRAAFEAAYKDAEAAVEQIAAVPGTLCASADALAKGLGTVYKAAQKVERVYLYAMLHQSGDNGDPDYQEMSGRATNLYVAFGTAASFVEPEILECDEQTLLGYLEAPNLKTYTHMIHSILRSRSHMLPKEQEKMLAMLSDVSGNCSNVFDMLESVDMTFPTVQDENGQDVTLTHGNFGVYRESRDVRVRREAFEKYFGTFRQFIHTFAALYAGSVKTDAYFSRVRGFKDPCEAALFASNVPVSVYDSLITAVHNGLGTMKKYLEIRKKALQLEELHMYDLYCPIVEDVEIDMPLAEAEKLVKKATEPLGEVYQQLLDRAYREHWLDVYENKGKSTGAFSCGVFGVHPYVMLNYTDTLDDAFTLAHELGHAMHSYFSDTTQDFVNHDYRIMVGEVASTVNEVLLTKYLLRTETDKKRRAYILNHFLEGFRTTIFRQTLFAEFEREAHDMYMAGTPLTAQSLNALYRRLNEQYYEGAVIDELQDIEWARIPHFYNAFYVYQYATGFSSAVAIASRILETGDASDYLRFLSTGGSNYPMEELKIAGVDLSKPDTVENAMKVFADALTEFDQLLYELSK